MFPTPVNDFKARPMFKIPRVASNISKALTLGIIVIPVHLRLLSLARACQKGAQTEVQQRRWLYGFAYYHQCPARSRPCKRRNIPAGRIVPNSQCWQHQNRNGATSWRSMNVNARISNLATTQEAMVHFQGPEEEYAPSLCVLKNVAKSVSASREKEKYLRCDYGSKSCNLEQVFGHNKQASMAGRHGGWVRFWGRSCGPNLQ